MSVGITFFDRASEISGSQKLLVQEQCSEAISKIERYREVGNIDVLVLCTDNYSQDKYAFTGVAISPHIVTVHMSPRIETLTDDVKRYFQSFIVHELHHCLRWPYFSKTIGEAIVLEGMAMSAETLLGFEERDLGIEPSQEQMASKLEQAYIDIAQPHDGSWIYYSPGMESVSLPWIYHLGKKIVNSAFDNKGWNPFDQIHLSAEEIFEAAGFSS